MKSGLTVFTFFNSATHLLIVDIFQQEQRISQTRRNSFDLQQEGCKRSRAPHFSDASPVPCNSKQIIALFENEFSICITTPTCREFFREQKESTKSVALSVC